MHVEARIGIDVGSTEQIFHIGNIEVCFFFHLTRNALLGCFVHVAETTGQVICTFGRFLFTHNNEQFVIFVQNKGCRGGTRI